MEVIKTNLLDVFILKPKVYGDNRGWFTESWSKRTMDEVGLAYDFVQDNHSFSEKKGTLRGLHYQLGNEAQAKLLRCTKGAVLDVAVDLREGSPTYKKFVAVELSEENKLELLIPRGFAHGFLTLTDNVEFMYKADNYYTPSMERNIIWNDKELNISWGIENPILAEKDKNAPIFAECEMNFKY